MAGDDWRNFEGNWVYDVHRLVPVQMEKAEAELREFLNDLAVQDTGTVSVLWRDGGWTVVTRSPAD